MDVIWPCPIVSGRLGTFVTLREIFQLGNMLCWTDRLQPARTGHMAVTATSEGVEAHISALQCC